MIKSNKFGFVAALALLALLGYQPITKADIPGVTLVNTVDLLPGPDVAPRQFVLNPSTHKLYVAGDPLGSHHNPALRIINSTSNQVIGAIDLGRYTGASNGLSVLDLAVDESSAAAGNKIYVVIRPGSGNAMLRVIDGVNDTNLTGEGTDVPLPIDFSTSHYSGMTVNSTNHKVYIAKNTGDIVVVDGPNRQILTTVDPNLGDFPFPFIIANPAANKIFVVSEQGGGVIDSTNDTFTPLPLNFFASDAVLNPANGQIYFVGHNRIYVVDGNTGQLITSRTDLPEQARTVTFVASENTLYVGTAPSAMNASSILALDGTDLSSKGSLAHGAFHVTSDPAVANRLFILRDYNFQSGDELQNMVGVLNPATGELQRIALGYRPFDIAINSHTNRVYVTDEQTSELLVLDGTSHAVISRIPVLHSLFKRRAAISERLNRIYVTRTTEDATRSLRRFIDVFDGATNQFLRSIPLIGSGDFVAVDDTRRRIYVPRTYLSGFRSTNTEVELHVHDADTEALIATIRLDTTINGSIAGLAANPVTGRVYVSSDSWNPGIAIVDGNTNTKVGFVSSVPGPIAINRKTNKVYIGTTTNFASKTVTVIDGATDSRETTFSTATQNSDDSINALAVDELTNRVYVVGAPTEAPSHTGRIKAFDANNNYQFLGQIDLGLNPVGVALNPATRQLFVSNDLDGTGSVLQDAAPAPADIFANISTRARVGAGDDVLIGGFIITGIEPKTVIVRGIGPSLGMAGALTDPVIEIYSGDGVLRGTNDNWNDAATRQEIIDSGLAPSSNLESALWGVINPGAYTVVVRDKNNAPGIGMFEVFDLDRALPEKLANISTRGHVDSGDNVMIAGVIVAGSKPVQVMLRAIGPSLGSSGVPNALEDPVLELRDPNGGLISSNDNWQEHEAEVNATLLAPTDPRESAMVARLYPANYTAIVRGKNGATGVALVEAYHLNQ